MMPEDRPTRRALLLGGAASALSGCSGLPLGGPPPQLYTLSPKSTFPPDLPTVTWQLAVDRPTSPTGLATARIAVSRGPHAIDYYAGAQWIDEAPYMVQRLLIESFENTGRIVGVARDLVSLRSDFVLQVELREFQAQYDPGATVPTVNVHVSVRLVRMPQRHIVASTAVQSLITAPDNRMASIIATFDEALGKVQRDLVVWTLANPATRT